MWDRARRWSRPWPPARRSTRVGNARGWRPPKSWPGSTLPRGSAGSKPRWAGAVEGGGGELVVGTHAVIQEQVQFKNLALAIIDEQHRFGVAQRLALRQK